MTKQQIKDIIARIAKTFVQAFIGSFTIDSLIGVTDADTFKRICISMLVAAVSAGVCAVWNTLLDFIYLKIDKAIPTDE